MKRKTLKQECNFTLEQINHLLSTINTLIKQAKAGKIVAYDYGICEQWSIRLNKNIVPRYMTVYSIAGKRTTYTLVEHFARTWPDSAQATQGDLQPIPDPKGDSPNWCGLGLEYRLDLMRHIARRLREWKRHMPKE